MIDRKALVTAAIAVAALALGAVAAVYWTTPGAPTLEAGVLLATPRPIADVELQDQDGRRWTPERLAGRWTLLFAGFTHCPDICPTTLGLLGSVERQLTERGVRLDVVFLSVDPQRDTPQRLHEYVRHFSAGMTGVTGEPAQLDRLCGSLGLAYIKVPGGGESDYTIDHSAALVLINPRAEVAGYFPAPHRLAPLVNDLATAVREDS